MLASVDRPRPQMPHVGDACRATPKRLDNQTSETTTVAGLLAYLASSRDDFPTSGRDSFLSSKLAFASTFFAARQAASNTSPVPSKRPRPQMPHAQAPQTAPPQQRHAQATKRLRRAQCLNVLCSQKAPATNAMAPSKRQRPLPCPEQAAATTPRVASKRQRPRTSHYCDSTKATGPTTKREGNQTFETTAFA